jgi:outer membrane protein W
MKKLYITALALGAVILAKAQDEQTFKPFKVDIAAGYALPAGSGAKAGALFAIEPKYALNDNLALGLRVEVAATAQGNMVNGQMDQGDVKASGSYLATADYYFNTNRFRPFVGAGAGIYTNASANLESQATTTDEVQKGSRFGFAPRAGFEFGHFRTGIEYNFAGKTANINHNYLGIKIGFFLGGGRYE